MAPLGGEGRQAGEAIRCTCNLLSERKAPLGGEGRQAGEAIRCTCNLLSERMAPLRGEGEPSRGSNQMHM